MTTLSKILTGTGRLVGGHPMELQTTDSAGDPLVFKHGDRKGQPRSECYFAVAFSKDDPDTAKLLHEIQAVAQREMPNDFDKPGFASKVVDGDGKDSRGEPWSRYEGYAGHFVLRFKSGRLPRAVSDGGASRISFAETIKRGYYCRVYFSAKGNKDNRNPGLYLNPELYEHVANGEIIESGPDAVSILAKPAKVPTGASAMPKAPRAVPHEVVQSEAPGPDNEFVEGTRAPAPPPPPAPKKPEGPSVYMLPAAEGRSYEAFIDAGWTDQQLRDAGYMS